MRMIDADALIIDLMDRGIDHLQTEDWHEIQQTVADAPTVDAVPVCRCRDCKHAEHWYGDKFLCSLWNEKDRVSVFSDGFCSYGERKGGDE